MISLQMSRRISGALFVLALVGFGWVFVRTAWVVDDAYITFRTIDNFLAGHGLTWNPGERVQAYTHPLWMFVISAGAFFTREYFHTSLTISFLFCAAALVVAFVALRREAEWKPFVFLLLFITSKAVVDYSSSGLENAASYFFVVLFYAIYLRGERPAGPGAERDLSLLLVIASLSYLNRQDTLLLYLPALAALVWEHWRPMRWRLVSRVAIACSPALAWLVFATFYYGFPFPNTAYAKMIATDLSLGQRIDRGSVYLLLSLRWDALAFVALALSLIVALRRGSWRPVLGLSGVLIYVGYVLLTASAATHMVGRFLAVPFVLGFFIAVRLLSSREAAGLVAAMALAHTIVNPVSSWKLGTPWYQTLTRSVDGYIDTVWFAHREGAGLIRPAGGGPWAVDACFEDGRKFRASTDPLRVGGCGGSDALGYFAFAAGPDKWVVDPLALPDPLLARLQPCVDFRDDAWRPGHFRREVPEGYLESILSGENHLADPGVREYYAIMRPVVSGPMWRAARVKSIVLLNLGAYDQRLSPYNAAVIARARSGQCRF